MKTLMRLMVVMFLFIGLRSMAAENLTVKSISATPVIDGKLNEEAWKTAKFADQFIINGKTNAAISKTSAAVLSDNDNLYVGIICTTTNPVHAEIRGREADIFQDDEVEVMIDPCTGGKEHLQMAVNAAGSRYDAWYVNGGKNDNPYWGGAWEAVAWIGAGEWTCELKIPFALFAGKGKTGAPWRINVCRSTFEPAEYSSLAADGSFNDPEKFIALDGVTKAPPPGQGIVFRLPWDQEPAAEMALKDGKMCCVARAVITNCSSMSGKAVICLEERGNNKRTRIDSKEIVLSGSESKEIALESSVELTPVDASGSMLQPANPLAITIASDANRLVYYEYEVPGWIRPVQIFVADQVKPEIKCLTAFSRDAEGNKNGKLLVTVEDAERGKKTLALHEYPLSAGNVQADFQADKLPAGCLIARACVKNAAGGVLFTNELVFAHLSKEPERLNNLVCRLSQGKLKLGKSEAKEITFDNPRAGWVWVKMGIRLIAQEENGTITVSEGGNKWLQIATGSEGETMRRLKEGPQRLMVSAAAASEIDYEIRSVPEHILSSYNYSPSQFGGTIKFGPYDYKYFEDNGLFKNVNGMIAPSGGFLRNHREVADGWIKNGGRWFVSMNPPHKGVYPYGVDKKEFNTNDEFNAEYVYKAWSKHSSLTNALDLVSGYFLDELASGYKDLRTREQLMPYAGGMRLMLADGRFKDKIIYPYLAPGDNNAYVWFDNELCRMGARPSFEWYLSEQPTETLAKEYIGKSTKGLADFEKKIPGMIKQSVLLFNSCNIHGNFSWDVYADVDFKVFLDLQFNRLANDPLFKDLGGVQWWASGYTDDETLRWCFALFRHYAMEGRTDRLSDKYGFKYKLEHIANADFDKGLESWETKSGTEGTLAAKEIKGYWRLQNRANYPIVEELGSHVLWMKRTKQGPNIVSQAVRGLETGKLYSLKMMSGDYGALMSGKSVMTNHVLSMKVENTEIIPGESFVGTVAAGGYKFDKFDKKNHYCFNYHWMIFRAKGNEARLTISDWQGDQNMGGPEGQELILNFIQVQPYFAKE